MFASSVVLRHATATGLVTSIGNPSATAGSTNGDGFAARFPNKIYEIDQGKSTSEVFFTSGNQIWYGTGPFSSSGTVNPSSFNFTRIGGDAANNPGSASGDGNTARFTQPRGIVYDATSNQLYICDYLNNRVVVGRLIGASPSAPTNWDFTTYAGTGIAGFLDASRTSAQFNVPDGLAIGADDGLYIGDNGNDRLRRIDLITGQVTTVAGDGVNGYVDGSPGQVSTIRSVDSDRAGSIYFYDGYRLRVYRNSRLYTITTNAGGSFSDGYVDGAGNQNPARISVNKATGTIYTVTTGDFGISKLVAFEAVVP